MYVASEHYNRAQRPWPTSSCIYIWNTVIFIHAHFVIIKTAETVGVQANQEQLQCFVRVMRSFASICFTKRLTLVSAHMQTAILRQLRSVNNEG